MVKEIYCKQVKIRKCMLLGDLEKNHPIWYTFLNKAKERY